MWYKKYMVYSNNWLGRSNINVTDIINMKYSGKKDNLYVRSCHKHLRFFDSSNVKSSDVSFRYNKVIFTTIEKYNCKVDGFSMENSPGIDKMRVLDIKYIKKAVSP